MAWEVKNSRILVDKFRVFFNIGILCIEVVKHVNSTKTFNLTKAQIDTLIAMFSSVVYRSYK